MAQKKLKVFVSSPGDLMRERLAVQGVIDNINGDYLGVVQLELIRWEEKSYHARAGFQTQIEEASACDLVIAMLYQRLGTPLPLGVATRADGSGYESGTAYEIETSLAHAQSAATPQLYMFRKITRDVSAVSLARDLSAVSLARDVTNTPDAPAQAKALAQFWQRLFVDASGQILRAFQSFEHVDDLQRMLDHAVRSWLHERGFLRDAPTWNTAVLGSPFRGLAAFEESHASVYFGRGVAVHAAWQKLLRAHTQGAGFLLVLGASGAGKSSLVKAGLLPLFRAHMNAHGLALARVAQMRPGLDPTAALAIALAQLDAFDPHAAQAILVPELSDRTAKYLLVIDQFEELFQQSDAVINDFAQRCFELVSARGFFLIATMRADCYASLLAHAELAVLKDSGLSFDVRTPSDLDIESMLRGPAAAAKLVFEKHPNGGDLADTILADLAGSDALALMQLTLDELYQRRVDATLTAAAYQALGGVQGALLSAAESAYANLDAPAQLALPSLLSELVSEFSDTDEAMCRPISAPESKRHGATVTTEPRTRLIAAFVEKRLLILDGAQVRVAHEALVRAWPRAVSILEAIASTVQLRARLRAPLAEWQRDAQALLPGGALLLSAAELLDSKLADFLTMQESAFIRLSRTADRAQRSRRNRRLSLIAAVMSGLAIIAGVMAWNAKIARAKAEHSFAASVSAVNALTRDLAENLRQSRGIRAETVASVLSKAQDLVAGIEKTDPGNIDLEFARIGMLLGFSETYRSVARSKAANTALDDAMLRLNQLRSKATHCGAECVSRLTRLDLEANLAASQRAYLELDLDSAERLARRVFERSGGDAKLHMSAQLKLSTALFFQNKLKQVDALDSDDQLAATLANFSGDALADALDFLVARAAAKTELGDLSAAKSMRAQAAAALTQALLREPNSAQLLQTRMRLKRAEVNDLLNGHEAQARALLAEEIALGQTAIDSNPNAALLRLAMKSLLNTQAQLHRKAGDKASELQDLRRVIALLAQLSEQDLENLFLRAEVAFARRRLAVALLDQSADARTPMVIAEVESVTLLALKTDRALIAISPTRPFARRYLAATLEQLGDLRKVQSQLNLSLAAHSESLQIRLGLAQEFPNEAAWQRLCGLSHSALKDVYALQGDLKSAGAAQAQASAAFAQAMALAPTPAAQLEWFDAKLLEIELLQKRDLYAPARVALTQLTQFADTHAAQLQSRPDLRAELKKRQHQQGVQSSQQ